MRCDEIIYNDWLKLMNYFEHELSEGEITDESYEQLVDALMSLKPWPEDEMIEPCRRKIVEEGITNE